MSIQQITCYVITCDGCHADFDSTDDYTVHFATPDEAFSYVTEHGWTVTDYGDLHCGRCSAINLCADLGHLWGPWIPCACQGHIAHHAIHGCGLARYCQQCDHPEYATSLADLPTTDEPAGR